ncbi:ArgP/LysG family DNA-binding transcriptional regulator [Aliamphritea spongicola]|nr:ArgP/LysG family DNA-binding transcriptional regulator [Aliamphritea spongicola]
MFDHRELVTLIAIFDEGSFEAAAKVLHVTTGAVSQRIKSLENYIGKPVLIRSNPLQLTGEGENIMQLARKIKLLQDEAMAVIAGNDHSEVQTLPVAVNHDSLTCWFSEAASNIATGLDGVLIDIKTTDKVSTNQVLKSGNVIAAITALDNPVPGCKVRRLGALEYFVVCSREVYSNSLAEKVSVRSLSTVPLILFDHDDHLDEQFLKG